ncbi:MAG: metal-dependent hydrolase [Desulfobulbaceae bacterium]
MMAPTHVMLGVGLYATISVNFSNQAPLTAVTLAAAALGSLAPDLDHPYSWLGKRLFFISIPLVTLIGHRGLTHSLIAAIVATAGLAIYFHGGYAAWAIAFLVGYLSHLAADWNTGGVPFLWPSRRSYAAPWSFPTGGILERVFALCFAAGLLYLGAAFIKENGFGVLL